MLSFVDAMHEIESNVVYGVDFMKQDRPVRDGLA
jgi:hypothetical protein